MANFKKCVPENVAGDFFVDSTCIDCDACRQIVPAVFAEAADTSWHGQKVHLAASETKNEIIKLAKAMAGE